ncbi:hypothetical protein C8R21_10963 [Nitrosospira multiformis]|jgi:hypothetical protein|uniref:Carboxypeptidase regulatory-like domain-containing protein n=1 Tax=Nitrosospira multiformis TaxID=1231 RepID=A0A2T5ICF9_9PROT|nr:hypothetical protein [Nitrosospira multiformis]PTQ81512.1 hypothetical protein C8R21_10963 [Nitrosospira multiformis]
MKIVKHILAAAIVFVLASIVSSPGFAQAGSDSSSTPAALPPVQSQGQTEYLTGGIGADESEAILQEARTWPLVLELTQNGPTRAAYISDVRVTIKDGSGTMILDTVTEGPFLLVRLVPGKYSIDASYESKTLHRDVSIGKGGSNKIMLLWPAPGNEEDR